jgi:hypothetical protein
VLTLTPASSAPRQIVDWIEAPPAQPRTDDAVVSRPLHGYQPGDPPPAPQAARTLRPQAVPTLQPHTAPAPQPTLRGAVMVNQPPLATLRWVGTGVIRASSIPV